MKVSSTPNSLGAKMVSRSQDTSCNPALITELISLILAPEKKIIICGIFMKNFC